MAKARNKAAAEGWTYIPVEDRELAIGEQSRFFLRPLTMVERKRAWDEGQYIESRQGASVRVMSRLREVTYQLVLSHVDRIENFPAGNARPWPADPKERAKYVEELMDDALADEIGTEIMARSLLGPREEETVGKSSAPELTSNSGDSSLATMG